MPDPYDQLAKFRELLQQKEPLFDVLRHVSLILKHTLSAQQASLFIYDREHEQLWTVLDDREEKIVVPCYLGIVGKTVRTGKVQLENEPYDNPNFFAEVDTQLAFYTQSILTTPILNTRQKVIGVIELLNKPGGFTKDDKNS